MNSLDKFEQLQSLMMGYDRCGLYWNKSLKTWAFKTHDEEHTAFLVDKDLDRLIKLLLNSDL